MSDAAAPQYVMGHNDRERRRLQLQASIINPITEQLLRRAGLTTGMHVLDIGSGVGDVALIAARLVGPTGSVTACDLDGAALSVLAERAAADGIAQITTVNSDVHEVDLPAHFDALIGRHILIHLPDPKSFLADALRLLKPGGLVVFREFDFSVRHDSYPPAPLRDTLARMFDTVFGHLGRSNTGTKIPSIFVALGLSAIDARVEYSIDTASADSPYFEWLAESLRSLLPRAQALGIAGAADIEIDTLAARLREEARANGSALPGPAMIGVAARK